ncbi:MAG: putative bifunctional diguanylate cyclase/phosphodiesterase [Cellvibrionaceae bacterium]
MNKENKSSTTPIPLQGVPLEIDQARYHFSLNGSPISWDTETGKMQFLGVDSSIFWLDPSLSCMFSPIVEEIGIDTFRLIAANSTSLGSQHNYEDFFSPNNAFIEDFEAWSNTVAACGWGKFKIVEYDYERTHAVIQIDNPWELSIQKNIAPEKRWGCPFALGKIIGLFKQALSHNCWATDYYEYLESGDSKAILTIYPSDKTIDDELEKLRKEKLTLHEKELEDEIIEKTAELQKSNNLLENIANLDFLTNLHNRRSLEKTLSRIKEEEEWNQYILMFVDLDQFKIINDTCGHLAGDRLLTLIGERLISCTQRQHFISRYGGDEFAILLQETEIDKAVSLADTIRTTISKTQFEWNERVYTINCSIGLTALDTIAPEVDNALIAADNACYHAKRNGRNQIYISEDLNEAVESRLSEMQWVHRVRDAIKENKFELYFQLIKPTSDNPQFSLEALIRMIDDDGSLIMPFKFLPAAENYDAIFELDCWVINSVFKRVSKLEEKESTLESVAINLSGNTLSNPNLENFISDCFEKYKIKPEKICFEVTETHMMMNIDSAKNILSKLRKHGCTISLDDFGAGMSSFAYLRDLPVDKIKIDGSFVKNMNDSMVDYTFVESIANVARAMRIKTVAEFVENERIVELLEDMNVDYLQGYHVGKPQAWDTFFK